MREAFDQAHLYLYYLLSQTNVYEGYSTNVSIIIQ